MLQALNKTRWLEFLKEVSALLLFTQIMSCVAKRSGLQFYCTKIFMALIEPVIKTLIDSCMIVLLVNCALRHYTLLMQMNCNFSWILANPPLLSPLSLSSIYTLSTCSSLFCTSGMGSVFPSKPWPRALKKHCSLFCGKEMKQHFHACHFWSGVK